MRHILAGELSTITLARSRIQLALKLLLSLYTVEILQIMHHLPLRDAVPSWFMVVHELSREERGEEVAEPTTDYFLYRPSCFEESVNVLFIHAML